jgi:hypothetical protein
MGQTKTSKPAGSDQTVGEEVKGAAVEVAGQAREELQDLRKEAGERARSTIDSRSSEIGTQMTSAASAVREAGSQLRAQGSGGAANVIEAVAERAERLGEYMNEASAERMLGDVESFARRRPWLVAGAAVTVGFVTSRLLKASSDRRYASSGNGWGARRAEPALEGSISTGSRQALGGAGQRATAH